MKFAEVIGQTELKLQLAESVINGKVSHAQLLLGREGSGNLALALALAQYINCTSRQGSDSCGVCVSCKKAAKLVHPDIHFTYPVVSTISSPTSADFIKPWREAMLANPYLNVQDWIGLITEENKQGNINVEECKRIIQIFNLKSFEGLYKILIIWMPEYLDKAGNKILKLLEEPPENSLFLLVANNEDAIISTILSRTQIARVPPVKEDDIAGFLTAKYDIPDAESRHIARMSDGNLREAILLAQHIDSPYKELWTQCLNAAATGNPILINTFVDRCSKLSRETLKAFFRYTLQFLHESLMLSTTGVSRLPDQELRMADSLNKKLSFDQLAYVVNLLETGTYHIERNANARIELMFITRHLNLMFAGRQPADLALSFA